VIRLKPTALVEVSELIVQSLLERGIRFARVSGIRR